MADRFIDAPESDTEPYAFVLPTGEVIEIDSITQESICVNFGNQDAMLPLGQTYRRNETIVYRDWPTVDSVISTLQELKNGR